MVSRRLRFGFLLSLALVPLVARSAAAQLVDEVLLVAVETSANGWFFEVEIEGSLDLTSAELTVPSGGGTVSVPCEVFGDAVGCELQDPADGMAGFATLDDLLAVWPVGTYGLAVSDGTTTLTADLLFDPTAPDGTITITSPTDGETDVGSTPTVSYDQTCTNCTHLFLQIETLDSPSGDVVDLEFESTSPPSSDDVPLTEFTDENAMPASELPNGTYLLDGEVTTESESEVSFNEDPAMFAFITGGDADGSDVTFTVPEPGSWAAGAAALGGLGLLSRSRRRPAAPASRNHSESKGNRL